jgi:hypothetical protein
MSIHINTPNGEEAALALAAHCLKTANTAGLHGDVLLGVCSLIAAAVAIHEPAASAVVALHLRNSADKIDSGLFAQIGQFAEYEAVQPQALH